MTKASDLRYRQDMAYLDTELFQSRQVLAAYYLRSCTTILEIGGFVSPVCDFLGHQPKHVIILDPRITAGVDQQLHGRPCQYERVRCRFQEYSLQLAPRSYGCAILGYSLKGMEADSGQAAWSQLVTLVSQASVAVLEYAPDWPLAAQAIDRLMLELPVPPVLDFGLDLGTASPEFVEYPRRRMLVFRQTFESPYG